MKILNIHRKSGVYLKFDGALCKEDAKFGLPLKIDEISEIKNRI